MSLSSDLRRSPRPQDDAPTSRSLLQGVKAHDNRAWDELVALYAPLVYHWCRKARLAEQDIPDIVQDVFRGVVTGIGAFRRDRPSDTFRGWLFAVTRNSLADFYRKRSRNPAGVGGSEAQRRVEELPDLLAEPDDDDRAVEHALFFRGLEVIRDQFDPKTWQAFWRVAVDGLSAVEAARELGMRPGTVRVSKSRVLQRLRRHLGDVD